MGINALIGKGDFDWHVRGNSPIVHQILLESGDWKDVSFLNEIQVVNYGTEKQYDTSMCVSYNDVCKPIAYILMRMIALNLIPAESVKWLKDVKYFKNGRIDFSERFTGIKGETSIFGAYQYKVANGAKNFGLIPNDMLKMADNFNDNINPKFITKEMEELGLEFLTHFSINYEWIEPEDTLEFKKYSPIGAVGQYADGDGILNPPSNTGHAMLHIFETDDYREIDDSYWRQFKKYNKSKLQGFMAFYITPLKVNNMDTAKWIKDNDLKWVQNSNNGQFGRVLRGRLNMVNTADRGVAILIDDKMRDEPSVKITNVELKLLQEAGLVINF